MSVQQSGNVTRGHIATWTTDGVIGDGGTIPAASERVLASLLNADFNTTADQELALPSTLQSFMITRIVVTNSPTNLTAAVGGFYTEAAKTGQQIVADTQVYSTLTGTLLLLSATLSSYTQTHQFTRTNLPDWIVYLSLTTPQGDTAPASVYLIGIELS